MPRLPRPHTLLVLVGLPAFASCGDEVEPTAAGPERLAVVASDGLGTGALAHLQAARQGRTMRGFEDDQLRLENMLPGFGGMARDSLGRLVVYVHPYGTHLDDVPSRLAQGSSLLGVSSAMRSELIRGEYELRIADFSFSQLVDWKDRLSALVLVRVPKVISVDANELRNRVTVVTEDEAVRGSVEQAASVVGIPEHGLDFEIGRPAYPLATLRDKFRPTRGGIQIETRGGICTLGFNVRHGSPMTYGFLTASHCTPGPRGVGATGDTAWQNIISGSNKVGTVTNNPPWNQTQPACGGYTYCTGADVMYVRYDNGISSPSDVAATSSYGTNNGAGSITVVGWWTNVWQPTQFPYQGDFVDKQGRTSGWTRGTVAVLCANAALPYGAITVMFLCDNRVDGARNGVGDSGAPVFNAQSSLPGSLYPYGILHAGTGATDTGPPDYSCTSGCQYWFNGTSMIQAHLQQWYFWYD